MFFGVINERDKPTRIVRLFRARNVSVKRHIKVKAEANPYAIQWEEYFEHRLDVQMESDLKCRKKFLRLWLEQDGLCPVCQEKITMITRWHLHHIIYRSLGGNENTNNLVLLHPDCHRQVHNQKLEVVKPRLDKTRR